jgi:hypothetical protein
VFLEKRNETRILKLTQLQSGNVIKQLVLDKKKFLVGSSINCDLCITDEAVSFYHSMLMLDKDGGQIIDLDSSNGVYINDNKVKSCYFSDGDILKFGSVEFQVSEHFIYKKKIGSIIIDQDLNIKLINESTIINQQQELKEIQALDVIDGEYCDILFDEEHLQSLDHIPAYSASINQSFVEYDDNKDMHSIYRHNKNKVLEITFMSNGTIINLDYVPLKNGIFFASSTFSNNKTVHLLSLRTEEICPFFSVDKGEITFSALPGFTCRNITTGEIYEKCIFINDDEVLSFDQKSLQIIVKVIDHPPTLRITPFFGRDLSFQKDSAKTFCAAMGAMLLLLFVDINLTQPKPKKIAVIYRQKKSTIQKNLQEMSTVINQKKSDKGFMNKQQDKRAKKYTRRNKFNIKKRQEKKLKIIQNSKKSLATKAIKQVQVKSYKFNTTQKINSLFLEKNIAAKTKINNLKPQDSNGFESARAQDTKGLKTTKFVNVKKLGQGLKGNYNSSSGAFGLAKKSGIDTSYVNPKTVVLASMDPELLRKILREYLPQFRHCYQKELQSNERLKGIIDLDFRISKSGLVSNIDIKVKNANFSSDGINCMASILKLIPFPKPQGGGVVDVRQPLSFFSETEKF